MDLLEDMIKKAYKKIDNANSGFCATPALNAKKTGDQLARTLLLGQGNLDDLLANPAKKPRKRCTEKTCTHQH